MGTMRCGAAGAALALLAAAACGTGGGAGAGKVIPAGEAAALAARADTVATDLAAGACDQALAEARALQTDLGALAVPAAVRDQAVAGAARLAGAITCAPPVTATTATVPGLVVTPVPAKGRKHKGGHGGED